MKTVMVLLIISANAGDSIPIQRTLSVRTSQYVHSRQLNRYGSQCLCMGNAFICAATAATINNNSRQSDAFMELVALFNLLFHFFLFIENEQKQNAKPNRTESSLEIYNYYHRHCVLRIINYLLLFINLFVIHKYSAFDGAWICMWYIVYVHYVVLSMIG